MFGKSVGIFHQKWIARLVLVAFVFCTFPIPAPEFQIPGIHGDFHGKCDGVQCRCASNGKSECCCRVGIRPDTEDEAMDSDFATVIASPAIASPASADRPPEGRAGDRASRKPVFSFAPHPKESYCGSSGKQQPKRGNVSATKSPSKLVSKVKSKSAHRFRVMTMESKKCTSNGFDLANASWMTAPTLLSIEFERTATKHIASVTIELTGIQFPPATPPPRAV